MDLVSCFDNRGRTLDKGTLANGNGTVISYTPSGKYNKTDNYINGRKEKKYKKEKNKGWPYYVGYYAFNDKEGLDKFRQKLHSLE